jgi:hypothetical protein
VSTSRKECIALRLATVVKSFFHVERKPPIYLQWKDDTMNTDEDSSKVSSVPSNNGESTPRLQGNNSDPMMPLRKEEEAIKTSVVDMMQDMTTITHNTIRSSARTKKPPSGLYDNFLW